MLLTSPFHAKETEKKETESKFGVKKGRISRFLRSQNWDWMNLPVNYTWWYCNFTRVQ